MLAILQNTSFLDFNIDLVEYERTEKNVPTMKSMGAEKNAANNAAQTAPAKSVATFTATADMAEKIDFSKVEVEPLFKDMVDFETFSKSDSRAVKVKECEAVPKSKNFSVEAKLY